jgi:REase_MTES_1575
MADAPYVCRNNSGKRKVDRPDRRIAALSSRQHGVVSRSQLLALGLTRHDVDYRLQIERLQPLYRAVYAVGHDALTREGRWMAAVLASGRGAVLSHRSAAKLWGIAAPAGIDVTVPKQRRPPAGIELHETLLPPDEITRRDRIPVTTISRTLFDCATILRPRQLESAMSQAEQQRLLDDLSLHDLLTRYPRRPGAPAVRALLAAREAGATVTRSELEVRFLEFVDERGLPPPQTNQWIEGFEVDCLWREQRLAVELDSRTFHDSSTAFERDRERDRILQAAQWRPIRVTWRQLDRSRNELDRDLRRMLGLSAVTLAS